MSYMPNVACGICVNILTRTTFHQLQLKCDDDENIDFDHNGVFVDFRRLTLGDGESVAADYDDVDNDHDNCNLSNDCADEDDKW